MSALEFTAPDIQPVSWDSHRDALTAIRYRVFVEEQQVPVAMEIDSHDPGAWHWLAYREQQPVATVRLQANGKVGRLAVLPGYRRQGLAQALLRRVIQFAREQGLSKLHLHAQRNAMALYRRFDFAPEGEPFDEAGIAHQKMVAYLPPLPPVPPSQRAQPLDQPPVLGESAGNRLLHYEADYRDHARALADQARRQLWLFSQELDFPVYDDPPFAQALSALVRRHRQAEVRILLRDSDRLVKSGHAVLNLARRLPSKVLIRRLTLSPEDYAQEYLLADHSGLLFRDNWRDYEGWVNYHQPILARQWRDQFDYLWQRSHPDPELRQLAL